MTEPISVEPMSAEAMLEALLRLKPCAPPADKKTTHFDPERDEWGWQEEEN